MIEYIVNGKPVKVRPEHEKEFLNKYPTAKQAEGNQQSSAEDATVEQETAASNQGTDQSQDNQATSTESVSGESLSASQSVKKKSPRTGVRKNEDGTESTHLMRRELVDGKWVVFPSLFQEKDGSWKDMSKEEGWGNIYKEAKKRGEVYEFNNVEEATNFADKGSWKEGFFQEDGSSVSQVIEDAKKVRSQYKATDEQKAQAEIDSNSYVDNLMDESQDDAEDGFWDEAGDILSASWDFITEPNIPMQGVAFAKSRVGEEVREAKERKDEREKLKQKATANLLKQRNESSEDQIKVADENNVNTKEYEEWLANLSSEEVLAEAKNIKKGEFEKGYIEENAKKFYEDEALRDELTLPEKIARGLTVVNPAIGILGVLGESSVKSDKQLQDEATLQKAVDTLDKAQKDVVTENANLQKQQLKIEDETGELKSVNDAATVITKDAEAIGKKIKSNDTNIEGLVSKIESIDAESKKISEGEYNTQEDLDRANARLTELNNNRSELFSNYEEQVASRNELFTTYESKIAERDQVINDYRESGGREWEDIKADHEAIRNQAEKLYNKSVDIGSSDEDIRNFLDVTGRNYGALANITGQTLGSVGGLVTSVGEFVHKWQPDTMAFNAYVNHQDEVPEFLKPVLGTIFPYIAPDVAMRRSMLDAAWAANEKLSANIEKPPKFSEIDSWQDMGEWASYATFSQAANTAVVAATGGYAMLILGASSSGSKFHEMDQDMKRYAKLPEGHPMKDFKYSFLEQYAVATGTGVIEGASEYVSIAQLGGVMKMMSKNPQAKRGFNDFIKRNFLSVKGLYSNIYDPIEEGVSEGISQWGGNILDKYLSGNPEKAGMSVWEGVDESVIQGIWSSGAVYKSPLIARNVSLAFSSTNVKAEMEGISSELISLTTKLGDPNLKDTTKNSIENRIVSLVARHSQLLNETVDNIENASAEDRQDLIDIDVDIARLKKENSDLSSDQSLTVEERRSLQEANAEQISLRVNQKNNIIAKLDEARNKKEVERQTKKAEKRSKKIFGEPKPFVRVSKDNVTEELGKWKAEETAALTDQLNKLEQQEAAMMEKGDKKGLAEIAAKKNAIQESMADVEATIEADLLESHGSSSENTGKIFVNTDFAGTKGKTNVAFHELFHQILKNTLADNPQAAAALGNALETHINSIDPDALTNSEYKNRLKAYKDQPADITGEEKLALVLDGIAAGHIKPNQTASKKVGNVVRRILQSTGFKKGAIKLDSPEAVLDFIMDVNAGNNNIFLRSTAAISKGAKEGFEVSQGLIKEFGGVETNKSKKALKKSAEASARIQKIWDSKGVDGIMEILDDSFIKNNIKKFVDRRSEAPGFDRQLLTEEISYALTGEGGKNRSVMGLIMDYPAYVKKQKAAGKPVAPLAGFINKQLANRMIEASNNILDEEFGMQLEEARTAEATDTAEDIINTNIEERSELRRELGFDAKMIQTIRNAVIKTFGTKLPDVESKDFRTALIQAFRTELKQPIQDLMGKGKDFDTFLGEHFQSVYKALPVETLIQMERMVLSDKMLAKYPNARRIFTRSRRITKPTEVDQLISEGKLPKDTNRESGPLLNTKLPAPNINEVMAFFRGQNMEEILGYKIGASTLGTRKDKLAMEMGVELAFDATSETLQDEKVQEKRRGILELQGLEQAENELAIIAKQIDRNPNLKFSKEGPGPRLSIGINQKNRDLFLYKLPEVLDAIQKQDVSPRDWKDIRNKMLSVFEGELNADTISKGELKAAAVNLVKYTEKYDNVIAKVGDVKEDLDTDQSLRDYLARASEEAILDKSLVQLLGGVLPKGFTTVTDLFNDPARFVRNRQQIVSFIRDAQQKGWSKDKTLRAVYTQFNGMYTSSSKGADGRYIKNADGSVMLDPNWENNVDADGNIINYGNKWKRYKKDDKLVKRGLAKVGDVKFNDKGNPIPQDFRGQIFLNSQDLIDAISEVKGFEDIKGKTWNQIGAETGFDKTTFNETSKAAVEDQNYDGRDAQAKEAQEVSEAITAWYFQGIEDGALDYGDLLMLGKMFGSNMKSPMKRAAGLGFIAVGMENVNPNKLGELAEYEHMIPTNKMILEMFKHFHKDGKLPKGFWNNYKVAVIPKTMDKVLIKNGLRDFLSLGQDVSDHIGSDQFNLLGRYYNLSTLGSGDMVPIRSIRPQDFGTIYGGDFVNASRLLSEDADYVRTAKDAELLGRTARVLKFSKEGKGMSTFDFDETLIIDGENFVIATKGNDVVEISSEDWPIKGPDLAAQGYEFDFSDFANVRGGKEGPLLQKMKNQIEKYGSKNVFVLTARQQDSATPIHQWLKSQGINIPLRNITGLGKSEGEAKAQWMLQKYAEGYNDMYFVDDALPNVKAVKDVLDKLDIKSKVVQAKLKFSKEGGVEFNSMLERNAGVSRSQIFSDAQAKLRGKKAGGFKFFVPPSAEDFKGLLYNFLGKGKQGDADMAFFKEHLLDPFSKGVRNINSAKQKTADEFKTLKKAMPNVVGKLNNKVPNFDYNIGDAIRVYLWNSNGIEIPGLSPQEIVQLSEHVAKDANLLAFAGSLGRISRSQDGYVKPDENWVVGSIASDLHNQTSKLNRADYLADWIDNKNVIFSPANMNKIEAVYGTDFRDALENMLERMETGSNRLTGGKDKTVNRFMDWINGSVGAVMFFNTRSAALQTLSTVNFIDWNDNNIFAASKAFANQPQYWKDFVTLFNSDMLKQRRAGMAIDVNLAELSNEVSKASGKDKARAALRYLLQIGFTPTQIADSFAISAGGSTFYRNKINKYLKEGMSQKEAEARAFEEFQEIAEETQQSSRPDLISQQQAGTLGRLILAWQNTPMQYTRLTKKAISDLVNGRGDWKSHVSRILYYGAMQNVIFGSLQTGLAFLMFGGDEDEEKTKTKVTRVANGALDTLLRGTGVYGAMASTLKNTIMKYMDEKDKPYGKRELSKVGLELVQLSPPIGSKIRKVMKAIYSKEFNKGVIEKMGVDLDNPALDVVGNIIEAATNVPLARTVKKAQQIEEAVNGNHEMWKRVALVMGWDKWSLGIKDADVEEAKAEVKQEKKDKKKAEKEAEKEETKKKEEQEKKDKGIKQVRCSGIKSNGSRCSIMVETKAKSAKCMYHKSYKEGEASDRDNDGIKEYRCTATTGSGKRCKNRTENKNKKCYAHQ